MTITAIIVDDEPLAREGIRLRLKKFPDVNIIAECASGMDAVAAVNSLAPDLLFLDIQMPEINGFEVVRAITVSRVPVIIFVTAFDKYAVKAFECHAFDYLLKPISEARFNDAMKTAVEEIDHRNHETYYTRLKSMMSDYLLSVDGSAVSSAPKIQEPRQLLTRIMIKTRGQIAIVSVPDIDYIEAAGDYVYIHSNSGKHIYRETLAALEEKLDPDKFARIHRSAIVNIEKIQNLRTNEHGDYDVYLRNGMKLKLSRTFKQQFQKMLGGSL